MALPAALATGGRIVLGAAPSSFGLVSESQISGPVLAERVLQVLPARFDAQMEPVRPFQAGPLLVVRGLELLGTEQTEVVFSRFALSQRSEGVTVEEMQRSLRSTEFSGQLDRMRAGLQENLDLNRNVTISVAGVSLGLSLVYVLWLIRSGVLMGSYLSALPAWRVLDPLPVLSRVDDEAQEDDEALDAVSDRGGNPLRGFG
ncbi:MAG: hypothetical protein LH617_02610 [Ramlibacter sp.]|nr:hypothetical protein [Ramlibacter sp.]